MSIYDMPNLYYTFWFYYLMAFVQTPNFSELCFPVFRLNADQKKLQIGTCFALSTILLKFFHISFYNTYITWLWSCSIKSTIYNQFYSPVVFLRKHFLHLYYLYIIKTQDSEYLFPSYSYLLPTSSYFLSLTLFSLVNSHSSDDTPFRRGVFRTLSNVYDGGENSYQMLVIIFFQK